MHRSRWPAALFLALAIGIVVAAVVSGPAAADPELGLDEIYAACRGDNPYFAVAALSGRQSAATEGAVLALSDTPDSEPTQHPSLGGRAELGAVYGLAYDWRRGHLYAAAFHRRGQPHGPGGPGQVYRIDLATGAVEHWASVDAGPDRHGADPGDDEAAADWVGKTSLGDIEIDDNGLNLYVTNLATGVIHRFSVPDGRPLGEFPHGASGEVWSANARLFGLAFRNGRLYHAVVDSRENESVDGAFEGYVYRTLADGSTPIRVADFELDYERTPPWSPWIGLTASDDAEPQPLPADIEFRPGGDILIGLRDRTIDMRRRLGAGTGDLLMGSTAGSTWLVQTSPEQHADEWTDDESLLGSLAGFPGFDGVVAPAGAPIEPDTAGAVWYHNASGADIARETILRGVGASQGPADSLGDVEVLCGPPGAMTATPTTTPSPTPSPTPTPAPAFLPVALNEGCPPVMVDVALVLDLSTSMRDETDDGVRKIKAALDAAEDFVALLELDDDGGDGGDEPGAGGSDRAAVVGFNNEAWVELGLTGSESDLLHGLSGLEDQTDAGTRLDLALAVGHEALADARPGAMKVLVLLTDGKPTGVPPADDGRPETTVLDAAADVRAAGVHVFTIGLGAADDVDAELLAGIAGSPRRYVYSPGASDLAEIYRELAEDVRCPPGRHDWGRPWP